MGSEAPAHPLNMSRSAQLLIADPANILVSGVVGESDHGEFIGLIEHYHAVGEAL